MSSPRNLKRKIPKWSIAQKSFAVLPRSRVTELVHRKITVFAFPLLVALLMERQSAAAASADGEDLQVRFTITLLLHSSRSPAPPSLALLAGGAPDTPDPPPVAQVYSPRANVAAIAASPEDAGSPEDSDADEAEGDSSEAESSDADEYLTCRDCHKGFLFTAGEQHFYESKGFSPPIRCSDCRSRAKAKQDMAKQGGTFIPCRDCKREFCFTENQQQRHADNRKPPPIRCSECKGEITCEFCGKTGHATDECLKRRRTPGQHRKFKGHAAPHERRDPYRDLHD